MLFLWSEARCCALPTHEACLHHQRDERLRETGEFISAIYFRVLNVDIGRGKRKGQEYFFSFTEGVVEDCI